MSPLREDPAVCRHGSVVDEHTMGDRPPIEYREQVGVATETNSVATSTGRLTIYFSVHEQRRGPDDS